jgi:hypothetical protein
LIPFSFATALATFAALGVTTLAAFLPAPSFFLDFFAPFDLLADLISSSSELSSSALLALRLALFETDVAGVDLAEDLPLETGAAA